jgi:broad specificity phosphatase PhoE
MSTRVTLALLRHGSTVWNETGRVQGHSDVPLSPAGERQVRGWRLPGNLAGHIWLTSPLVRARQTAALLGAGGAAQDPRLIEMSWGAWEGLRLEDLRAELGNLMRAWEAKGLDFCAPEGESPRQVQARLRPFLAETAARGAPALAVTHKGVMRALYALATGWDMTDKPAHKLRDDCVHVFRLAADGTPEVQQLNVSLIDD